MRFAIIGCGLIGHKRAAALGKAHTLQVAADTNLERAQALARTRDGASAVSDYRAAVTMPEVEVVVVATTNDNLAPVTLAAVQAGKHVMVEKPAARSVAELTPVREAAERQGVHVMVGMNHRRHAAMQKAREIIDSGALGPLMFLRGRYGHGGRPGYDREWRANPKLSGGGELIDQGVHLIDLARWFLGDFTSIDGFADTFYWDMKVDDNAFLLLRTATGRAAMLHASCTEWKNLFSMEIYGRDGKLQIDGLGGSYGVERITYYRMLPEMGPPETTIWEYPRADESWKQEIEHLVACIESGRPCEPNLRDMVEVLKVVEEIYRKSASQ